MTAPTTGPAVTLTFVEPIPGLGALTEFTLTPIDDGGLVFMLRSVDAPQTRLFLLDPEPYFPTYRPDLSDDQADLLGLDVDGVAAAALVVITPSPENGQHTANLLAPVVFNSVTGAALQVVLEEDLPIRAPLVQA